MEENSSADRSLSEVIQRCYFEQNPIATIVVGKSGEIVLANRQLERLLRIDRGDLASVSPLSLSLLFSGDPRQMIGEMISVAGRGRVYLEPKTEGWKKADRIAFDVTPLTLSDRKKVDYVLLSHCQYDQYTAKMAKLTTRQAALRWETAREKNIRDQLEREYVELEEFSRMAAHDLKAPLRHLFTLMNTLQSDYGEVFPDEAATLLNFAEKSARRLHSLVSDLLGHARCGKQSLSLDTVSVEQAVHWVERDLIEEIDKYAGTILTPTVDACIRADRSLLHQLLQNLIGNALKYRSPERAPVIHIQLDPEEGRLTVGDNGVGFDNSQKEKIFGAFQRLPSTSHIEGSGVGLATCQRICQRHGWKITAEGEPDKGALFTVTGIEMAEEEVKPPTETDCGSPIYLVSGARAETA
ncbi:sensory box histidine kinase [Parvularcula bermudensis HTCC2503]|uniref:histidine kinase n=1 Tax=Parvularcula bermudensis (strain ATCC BAA-594 / HTCC2503 / KCTC 12087) TaxID=314260 RepID=E0TI31_PARBH|nr:ATP-binding protein [Parvularcula bermudensis]ADM09370.1 sensory box histidine kinase [Parvularcula bermudensis HTCC2503]